MPETKIVIVLDGELPAPIAANTSALLALTIGSRHPEIVGRDLPDADGRPHAGISELGVPILKSDADGLGRLAVTDLDGVEVVDFTETAARARSYDGYAVELGATAGADLRYLGVGLIGPAKAIKSLTGSLPLMR